MQQADLEESGENQKPDHEKSKSMISVWSNSLKKQLIFLQTSNPALEEATMITTEMERHWVKDRIKSEMAPSM